MVLPVVFADGLSNHLSLNRYPREPAIKVGVHVRYLTESLIPRTMFPREPSGSRVKAQVGTDGERHRGCPSLLRIL